MEDAFGSGGYDNLGLCVEVQEVDKFPRLRLLVKRTDCLHVEATWAIDEDVNPFFPRLDVSQNSLHKIPQGITLPLGACGTPSLVLLVTCEESVEVCVQEDRVLVEQLDEEAQKHSSRCAVNEITFVVKEVPQYQGSVFPLPTFENRRVPLRLPDEVPHQHTLSGSGISGNPDARIGACVDEGFKPIPESFLRIADSRVENPLASARAWVGDALESRCPVGVAQTCQDSSAKISKRGLVYGFEEAVLGLILEHLVERLELGASYGVCESWEGREKTE